MSQLPDYNTHPIRCGNRRCTWKGLEGQLARRDMEYTGGIKASQGICPMCSCSSYDVMTAADAKLWHETFIYAQKAFGLSDMQLTVLRTMADGRGRKAAASKLHKSPSALQDHLKQVYRKLGCTSIERAILLAERSGLLQGVA